MYPTVYQPPASVTAPYGYDVQVDILAATNLPGMDWDGGADPYCLMRLQGAPPGTSPISYRTNTVHSSLNPVFSQECFSLGNLREGSLIDVEMWDKDVITKDDLMGEAKWVFAPHQWEGEEQQGPDSGSLSFTLELQHPGKPHKSMGQLRLKVTYEPSLEDKPTRMLGPVRYRQHLSPVAGLLLGVKNDDSTMAFSTYKLFLCNIASIFEGVKHSWNRNYDKAQQLFGSSVLLAGVRTQHSSLYSTTPGLGRWKAGVLPDAASFFALFNNGLRGGQRRYFTYMLLLDSFRCSETGASFFTDMMSKHAMHAGGDEEVLYAGEFCILPEPGAPGGQRLIIDNNSGTYAPSKEYLPLMAELFTSNFPGMVVETVDAHDPRLKSYHQLCPSRAM